MSQEKDYDSVLMGWTNDPKMVDGEFQSITFRVKDVDLKEALDNYVSKPNENGEGGGYVKFTCFRSKAGKFYTRVLNPNSKAFKDYKDKVDSEVSSGDLPF